MDAIKLSSNDVAVLFDLTPQRIRQLRADGIISASGKPLKYDLVQTVQSYIKFLSNKAYGREQKMQDADLETQKLEAEARLKKAKAEMAELELKELRGELHRASDVEEITTDHVLFMRSMLMALPGKLAVDLAGTHTAAEQTERVKKELYYILDSLSEYRYDQEAYKKRVRERQGWKELEKEE